MPTLTSARQHPRHSPIAAAHHSVQGFALTEQRLNFAVPPQSTLCSCDLLQNRYIQPWVSRARLLQLAIALSLARFSREASLSCAVERACAAIASLHVLAWAGASATMLAHTQIRASFEAWSTMFTQLD